MKRILPAIMTCLVAITSLADFEIEDPASPEAIEAAEKTMRPIGKSSAGNSGESIRLAKSDYLNLIIGNHVHGFKSFDSLVKASDDTVFVGIFHAEDEGEKARAEKFAAYLRKELPVLLARPEYKWARDVELKVAVVGGERF